jgi:ribosomal protein S18 acetylase RimI-like enzyme
MFRTQPSVHARAGSAPPWTVRPARTGDAEAWHVLQRVIYREGVAFVGDGPPSVGTLAGRLRARVPDASHVAFAASGGGELVGWVEVQRMAPRRLAHVAWLTIAVAPDWRRQGVGAALMGEARAWAEGRRLRKLQLHVRAGNAAALALYGRLGYESEGVLRDQVAVGDPDGPSTAFEDEWIMALRLPLGRT